MASAPGDQAAKAPDFPHVPASDEELEALLAQPGIKVIDLYGWAGPCQAAVPRFREMQSACQDESVLQFLQVKAEGCEVLEQAKERIRTCEPRFLIFKDGWLKDDIKGPYPPAVRKAVKLLMDPPPLIAHVEAQALPKENPFAAAIAARKAEAEKAEAQQPPAPPGSYQALLQALS